MKKSNVSFTVQKWKIKLTLSSIGERNVQIININYDYTY